MIVAFVCAEELYRIGLLLRLANPRATYQSADLMTIGIREATDSPDGAMLRFVKLTAQNGTVASSYTAGY